MASFTHKAVAYEGYSPGGPDNRSSWDMPMSWDCVASCSSNLSWYQPLVVPFTWGHYWHWKLKKILPAFSLEKDAFLWEYNVDEMTRTFTDDSAITDEHDLKLPGILASDTFASPAISPTRYKLVINDDGWNGALSELDYTLTVELMSKDIIDATNIPHFTWQQDGTVIQPSIVITGSFRATTPGTEYIFNFTNAPNGVDQPTDISFLADIGGGDVSVAFEGSDTYDAFSLSLTASQSFSWQG